MTQDAAGAGDVLSASEAFHPDFGAARILPPELPLAAQGRAPARELLAILLLIVLADVTLYRGHGYAGYALLFAVAPLLLMLGVPRFRARRGAVVVGVMLTVLAARMLWPGTPLQMAVGFALIAAFALALAGRRPYVIDVLVHALQSIAAGFFAFIVYGRSGSRINSATDLGRMLPITLPLVAVAGFGTVFILANPDIATSVGEFFRSIGNYLANNLAEFVPDVGEVLMWILVAWIAAGLLRPVVTQSILAAFDISRGAVVEFSPAPIYSAVRNTLVAVIALFAVYLVFEFQTLWFREFPKGFYYAGYAHEGAAWLTFALALATCVLSAIFQGATLRDARLPRLRLLAWIWSAENIVLALAVYNRMFIYVDFNGMTRMRTVAFFGITAVLVGFVLVVWKIVHSRNFVWLIRAQLWTLAIAIYLLSITPVDALVHSYNVRRVLAGDLPPSVQITVHPIDSQGYLVLRPLVNSQDPTIREGIRAMLAEQALDAHTTREQQKPLDWIRWTAFQGADRELESRLNASRSDWQAYVDPQARRDAIEAFRTYAYQWY